MKNQTLDLMREFALKGHLGDDDREDPRKPKTVYTGQGGSAISLPGVTVRGQSREQVDRNLERRMRDARDYTLAERIRDALSGTREERRPRGDASGVMPQPRGAQRAREARERMQRDWESAPAPARVATSAARGLIGGLTFGHPGLLASQENLERFDATRHSGPEQLARGVGTVVGGGATMMGLGGLIGIQNAGVGSVAGRYLPRTTQLASRALQAPGAAGRAARAVQGAAEGVLVDAALSAPGTGAENVALGAGIGGAVGALLPGASERALAALRTNDPPITPPPGGGYIDRAAEANLVRPAADIRSALADPEFSINPAPRAPMPARAAAAGGQGDSVAFMRPGPGTPPLVEEALPPRPEPGAPRQWRPAGMWGYAAELDEAERSQVFAGVPDEVRGVVEADPEQRAHFSRIGEDAGKLRQARDLLASLRDQYVARAANPEDTAARIDRRLKNLDTLIQQVENRPPVGNTSGAPGYSVLDRLREIVAGRVEPVNPIESFAQRTTTMLGNLRRLNADFIERAGIPHEMALDWYKGAAGAERAILELVQPERAMDSHHIVATMAHSLLSNGQEVPKESEMGMRVVEQLARTGRISLLDVENADLYTWVRQTAAGKRNEKAMQGQVTGGFPGETGFAATRSITHQQNLAKLEDLVRRYGVDGTADYLMESRMVRRQVKDPETGAKSFQMVPEHNAVAIFGPKIGQYFLDKLGVPSEGSTIDLWMARLYWLLRGEAPPTKVATQDMIDRKLAEMDEARREAEAAGEEFDDSEWEIPRLGETVIDDDVSPEMRKEMQEILRRYAEENGAAPSAAQAISWYTVKELFNRAGAREKAGAYSTLPSAARENVLSAPRTGTGAVSMGAPKPGVKVVGERTPGWTDTGFGAFKEAESKASDERGGRRIVGSLEGGVEYVDAPPRNIAAERRGLRKLAKALPEEGAAGDNVGIRLSDPTRPREGAVISRNTGGSDVGIMLRNAEGRWQHTPGETGPIRITQLAYGEPLNHRTFRSVEDARAFARENGWDEVSEIGGAGDSVGSQLRPLDEDLWDVPQQEISSAETSINSSKLPAVFSWLRRKWEQEGVPEGSVNIDIGGGRFDNVDQAFQPLGVTNLVFDPFNRSGEHNQGVLDRIRQQRADTATVSNVLNVIREPENRLRVLRQADDALKPGGTAYITVYEGDSSGAGRVMGKTTQTWQEHRPTRDYLAEVQQVFPEARLQGKVIVAPKRGGPEAGFADPAVMRTIAGAGVGAAAGGALDAATGDDDSLAEGVIGGALAGAGGATAARRLGNRGAAGATVTPASVQTSSSVQALTDEEIARILGEARPQTREGRTARAVRAEGDPGDANLPALDPDGPDPDDYVNLSRMALDPTGRDRLARQVQRMVASTTDLDPKQVVSWKQTMEEATGIPRSEIIGDDANLNDRARALAARNVMRTNVEEILRIETTLNNASLPQEQVEKLHQMRNALEAQNIALLDNFTRARSDAGRLLNSYKILAQRTFEASDPIPWLARARDLAGPEKYTDEVRTKVIQYLNSNDRAGMFRYLQQLRTASPSEKAVTLWKAGMLTNPLTHIVNATGNTGHLLFLTAAQNPVAMMDWALSKATGLRTQSFLNTRSVTASLTGARKGVREALDVMRGVPLDDALKKWDIPKDVNFDTAILDLYAKTVFRSLSASDRVFRGAAMHFSLANQAETLARAEGHKGQALKDRIQELRHKPTDEMALRAIHDAEVATFQDRTRAYQALQGFTKPLGVAGQIIAPFQRTPSAIGTRLVEYSPLGGVAGAYDALRLILRSVDESQIPAVQRRAVERMGRSGTAMAPILLGYSMYQAGLATGSFPTDQGERNRMAMEQVPPNAINVGGNWLELGRMAPIGNLVALGANLAAAGEAGITSSEALSQMAFGAMRILADQPFLTGINDATKAVTNPTESAGRYVQNLAGSVVPAVVGAVARAGDPVVRQPEGLLEQVQSRIPGMSNRLAPKIDPLGNPVTRDAGLSSMLNPLRTTPDRLAQDPTLQLLHRYGVVVAPVDREKSEPKREVATRQQEVGASITQAVERITGDREPPRPAARASEEAWGQWRRENRMWWNWHHPEDLVRDARRADVDRELDGEAMRYEGWSDAEVEEAERKALLESVVQAARTDYRRTPGGRARTRARVTEQQQENRVRMERMRERLLSDRPGDVVL